jgi:processive 1,2-diacylglycerol beta-glucosyltransferase
MPAEIVSWMRARRGLECRLGIAVTDFDVHAMWLVHHYDHYFVAREESRAHLVALGIAPAKVTVSGIPIRPIFAAPKAKEAMRHKHALEAERTTILVSAGGFGVGPVAALLTTLGTLQHPAQVLAICGKNEALRLEVEALAARHATGAAQVRIQAVGYTTAMDEYMAAADLLVGKPGGLTISEALAKGLVCVIVHPIQGQEERNADHLLEEGAAIRCNNLPTLAWKIDRLLRQPARFAAMQAQARRLARPQAAATIVQTMLASDG